MSAFKTISRVTVYADGALEQHLIEQFLKIGVTGYTVLECRGKGKHELEYDPFQGVARVRIEMLVVSALAEKLIVY